MVKDIFKALFFNIFKILLFIFAWVCLTMFLSQVLMRLIGL